MLAGPAAGEVAQSQHGGVGDMLVVQRGLNTDLTDRAVPAVPAGRDNLPGLDVLVVQCGKNPNLGGRTVPALWALVDNYGPHLHVRRNTLGVTAGGTSMSAPPTATWPSYTTRAKLSTEIGRQRARGRR